MERQKVPTQRPSRGARELGDNPQHWVTPPSRFGFLRYRVWLLPQAPHDIKTLMQRKP